jgi:hypothetical protein
MNVSCFLKMDSNLPVCGVHKKVLVPRQIAVDPNAPGLGRIPCHICPVSRFVVREVRETYATNAR